MSWVMAAVLLLAPLRPTLGAILASDNQPTQTTEDFLDKWILNGGSIGSAAGAILGQLLGTVLFPGPVGWVVGSIVGGFVGGIIGTLVDNKIHNAYNYTSFERPPLEDGGLYLEGVGKWEQGFYQVDQWAISGGTLGSLVGHFGANLLGSVLPGPFGVFISSIGGIFLTDVIFGTLGDSLDGMIDLGLLGRKIDEAQEDSGDTSPAAPETSTLDAAVSRARGEVSTENSDTRREAYKQYLELMKMGQGQEPEARRAFERYQALSR
jgi:hypothetical protein